MNLIKTVKFLPRLPTLKKLFCLVRFQLICRVSSIQRKKECTTCRISHKHSRNLNTKKPKTWNHLWTLGALLIHFRGYKASYLKTTFYTIKSNCHTKSVLDQIPCWSKSTFPNLRRRTSDLANDVSIIM